MGTLLLCINWMATLSIASAIAAIAGVIVGILSWRQVVNSQKAKVIVVLKPICDAFCLVVMNTGQSPAKRVTFTVNSELLDLVGDEKLKTQFSGIIEHPFTLLSGDQKQLFICSNNEEEKKKQLSEMTIAITGQYIDTYVKYNSVRKIREKLTYNEYITSTVVIPNPMLDRVMEIKKEIIEIKNKIKKQNDTR